MTKKSDSASGDAAELRLHVQGMESKLAWLTERLQSLEGGGGGSGFKRTAKVQIDESEYLVKSDKSRSESENEEKDKKETKKSATSQSPQSRSSGRRRRSMSSSLRESAVKTGKVAKQGALGLSDVLIRQIKSVDLLRRFGFKIAVFVALTLLLFKLAFVAIFTFITQQQCVFSSDLISADYVEGEAGGNDFYTKSFQQSQGQYLCQSASQDELSTNLFEYRDLNKDNFDRADLKGLNLSSYGFDHVWTAKENGLPYHPLTIFFAGYNLKRTAYIHECAEYCGQGNFLPGANFVAGFAGKTIDGDYECICMSNQVLNETFMELYTRFASGDDWDGVIPAPPCLVDYNYHSVNQPETESDTFSQQDFLSSHTFKPNCSTVYNDAETGWKDQSYLLWGRKLFRPSPLVVFSKRPSDDYRTCNEAVPDDNACRIHNNYLPRIVGETGWSTCYDCPSRVNDPPILCIGSSENCGPCYDPSCSLATKKAVSALMPNKTKADLEFTRFTDGVLQSFGKAPWVGCKLPGFTCSDYGSSSCPKSPSESTAFKVGGSVLDPFDFQCHDEMSTCIGITSVTTVVCPLMASTIGAAMGFMDIVELVLVSLLVGALLCRRGDHNKVLSMMKYAMVEDETHYIEKDLKELQASIRRGPVSQKEWEAVLPLSSNNGGSLNRSVGGHRSSTVNTTAHTETANTTSGPDDEEEDDEEEEEDDASEDDGVLLIKEKASKIVEPAHKTTEYTDDDLEEEEVEDNDAGVRGDILV